MVHGLCNDTIQACQWMNPCNSPVAHACLHRLEKTKCMLSSVSTLRATGRHACGNLIHGTFCFWRKIFAILRENLSFWWIFWYFSYKYFLQCVQNSQFWQKFWHLEADDVSKFFFFQKWKKCIRCFEKDIVIILIEHARYCFSNIWDTWRSTSLQLKLWEEKNCLYQWRITGRLQSVNRIDVKVA